MAVCLVIRKPSLFLTQMTQPAFFFFYNPFISAEPTLVGRVSAAWWLVSLGAAVTASYILFP